MKLKTVRKQCGLMFLALVPISLAPAVLLAPLNVEAGERPADPYAIPAETIRAQLPPGVRWIPDIPYRSDTGDAGLLDVVYPETPGQQKLPAIVFVHGGGWRSGSKHRPLFILPALRYAAAGYVCITINYRLAQEAPFPAALEDVKTAVRWLRAHSDEYHIDPDRIGAFGNSAGAHLALMLAMTGPSAGFDGTLYPDQSSAVQAVCAAAVPADLGVWAPEDGDPGEGMSVFLAGPDGSLSERAAAASPISYVRADAPPMLLIHGTHDTTVPVEPLDRFVASMREVGHDDLEYIRIDGAGHMVFHQHADQTGPAMSSFFSRTLGGGEVTIDP
jgi:acetyl esterase/lipase